MRLPNAECAAIRTVTRRDWHRLCTHISGITGRGCTERNAWLDGLSSRPLIATILMTAILTATI
jgi:hypothetical protein